MMGTGRGGVIVAGERGGESTGLVLQSSCNPPPWLHCTAGLLAVAVSKWAESGQAPSARGAGAGAGDGPATAIAGPADRLDSAAMMEGGLGAAPSNPSALEAAAAATSATMTTTTRGGIQMSGAVGAYFGLHDSDVAGGRESPGHPCEEIEDGEPPVVKEYEVRAQSGRSRESGHRQDSRSEVSGQLAAISGSAAT